MLLLRENAVCTMHQLQNALLVVQQDGYGNVEQIDLLEFLPNE
jgi:hypothetical protein